MHLVTEFLNIGLWVRSRGQYKHEGSERGGLRVDTVKVQHRGLYEFFSKCFYDKFFDCVVYAI